MLKKTLIEIGAQNCHENDNYGSYTGSVNSKMLKNIGAKYVIIGHSENREAGESDKLINQNKPLDKYNLYTYKITFQK